MQGFPVWNIVKSFFLTTFFQELADFTHLNTSVYLFNACGSQRKNLTSYFHFSEKPVFSYFTLLVSDTD